MSNESLVLEIVDYVGTPGAGTVLLHNRGEATVRVWRTGNHWGDTAIWFELARPPLTTRVARGPQVYTRNVPSSLPIPPGGVHRWSFDFGDGSWESELPLEQVAGAGSELTAVHEVGKSPEALANGVWIGCVRSQPMRAR